MEPTIYKPSIYKGAGIYKTGAGGGGGGGGEDLPVNGDLTNDWDFLQTNPNRFTDKIGSIIAQQLNNGGDDVLGYPYVYYTYGICLNAEIKTKDYIELELQQYNTGSGFNGYLRILNKTDSYLNIDQYSSILIGPQADTWKSYFGSWSNTIFPFVVPSKLGIFFSSDSTIDLFLDNILVAQNFNNNWKSSYSNRTLYAVGGTTTNYTQSQVPISLRKVKIYRNCTLI